MSTFTQVCKSFFNLWIICRRLSYIGYWKNNIYDGNGILKMINGMTYEVRATYSNNEIYSCIFNDNTVILAV